ncbi:GNAT family N-acetyltransferase [bacterium]|nr:GNAT family N-acetyltransferase [bacterium]
MKLTIRTIAMQDVAAVARMAQRLAASEGEGRTEFNEEAIRRDVLCQHPHCVIWVAEAGGQPVAFLMAYPGYDMLSASTGWHLGDLWVEPGFRRQGIATQLVLALAAQAKDHGSRWISLTRLKQNHEAKEFYTKLGFFERWDVCFHAAGGDAFLSLANASGGMQAMLL